MPILQERMRRLAPDGEDALIRRIEALERSFTGASTTALRTTAFSDGASGLSTIPTTWTTYSSPAGEYVVPVGFPLGVFTVTVACGDSLQSGSTASLSVQPVVRAKYADGTYSAWTAFGDAIAGPESRVTVASATTSTPFDVRAADPVHGARVAFGFGVNVARTGGTEIAGNGNWHLTVAATATRG